MELFTTIFFVIVFIFAIAIVIRSMSKGYTPTPKDRHEGYYEPFNKENESITEGIFYNGFFVDIPSIDCVDNENGAWIAVESFHTKEEAIAFAKKHFGADDEGKVSLVTG